MAGQDYSVRIIVDLLTGRVKTGAAELNKLLAQIDQSQRTSWQKLQRDELRDAEKFNRDRAKLAEQAAKSEAEAYQKHLGSSFFSKLAHDASSSFKSAFSLGGVGGGGGISGLLGNALGFAGGNLITSAVSSVAGYLKDFVKQGIDFNDQLERAHIGFTTVLGDEKKATELMRQLIQFGTVTPFKTTELVEYAQRLLAVGFKANQIIPILKAAGDAAAGLGGGADLIDRLTLALGQIKTKGRVAGEELRQLQEAGVPALEILAKAAGTSTAEIQKLAEKGVLNADRAVVELIRGMEQRFPDLMKNVQNTYSAQLSTLEDITEQRAGQIFQPLFEEIKKGQATAITALSSTTADRIAGSAAAIQQKVLGVVNSAFSKLAQGDVLGYAEDIGGGIVSGITKGVQEGAKEVTGAASQMAQDAIDEAKRVLGIKSPSAVFFAIGLQTAQGLILGIRAGLGQGDLSPEIEELIRRNAERTGVPADLIRAIIKQESGGHRTATSGKGAQGLMQLMPATAARFGVQNVFDPAQNIRGGTDYLAWLLRHFGGDVPLALAGYNAGEGSVEKYHGIPPYRETRNYVSSVFGRFRRYQQGAHPDSPVTSLEELQGLERRDQIEHAGMPVYVTNIDELRGLQARDLKEHASEDEIAGLRARDLREHGDETVPYLKVPQYDERGQLMGYQGIDPTKELPVIQHNIQSILQLTPPTVAAVDNFGRTATGALNSAGQSADDLATAFGNLPPLIDKSGDAAKEAQKQFEETAHAIVGVFGDSFTDALTRGPLEGFKTLRREFASMIISMARDWFESKLFKSITGQQTGGGGLFAALTGGLRRLFGGGAPTTTAPYNPNSSGAVAPGSLGSALAGGLLNNPALAPLIGGGVNVPTSATATATQQNVARQLLGDSSGVGSQSLSTLLGGGTRGSLGSLAALTLPFAGLSLGSQFGGALGGVGGLLLGGAGAVGLLGLLSPGIFGTIGTGTAAGSAGALAGLGPLAGFLTNPFTIGIAGAALLAGVIISHNAARRRDERTRDKLASDARTAIYQLIGDVKSGRVPPEQAGTEYQKIIADYTANAQQLRDKKTREHALLQINDFNRDLLPLLQKAVADALQRQQISSLLHPTYTFNQGGAIRPFADGGALSSMFRYDPLGYIQGPGTARSDSITAFFPAAQRFARVSNTEYVLDADTVRNIGVANLDRIRANKGLADGGTPAPVSQPFTRQSNAPVVNVSATFLITVGPETSVKMVQQAAKTSDGQRAIVGAWTATVRDSPSHVLGALEVAEQKQRGPR
jgi:tape measure domain-containing protein